MQEQNLNKAGVQRSNTMISITDIQKKRKKSYQESYLFDFSRWWSLPFTWIFANTSISPNAISLGSFVLTLIACGYIMTGNVWDIFVGGVILWFSFILDLVDGEVARIKKLQSDFGAWFDGVFDRVGDVILFTAITVALFRQTPTALVVLFGALATASTTLWRLNALQTKTSFNIPLTSKNPLKRIGFDTAFMYVFICLGLLLNGHWFAFSRGDITIHVNVLFMVLLFFAVVINVVTLKNIVAAYYTHKPKEKPIRKGKGRK